MTIFVIWELLDSIRNSCNVFSCSLFYFCPLFWQITKRSLLVLTVHLPMRHPICRFYHRTLAKQSPNWSLSCLVLSSNCWFFYSTSVPGYYFRGKALKKSLFTVSLTVRVDYVWRETNFDNEKLLQKKARKMQFSANSQFKKNPKNHNPRGKG